MEKNPDRQRPILVCGLAGIIGALLTIISDLILLGRPVNAVTFLKFGTASMANLAQWRIDDKKIRLFLEDINIYNARRSVAEFNTICFGGIEKRDTVS